MLCVAARGTKAMLCVAARGTKPCCVLQQEANGQLFVDDYHSFRYKQGAYGFISYSFTNHKLHSK